MSMKKYYQIHYFALPEVIDGYAEVLSFHTKETIESILNMSKDELLETLSKLNNEDVNAYYRRAIRRKIYADEAMHHKWCAIPKVYKKRTQYLINQMLLEKLKEVNL